MAEQPAPRRSLSLTCRLVAGYTVISLLTLAVAGFFLLRGLRRGFENEDGELLSDRMADIRRDLMLDPSNIDEARDYITRLAGERKIEKLYARLIDSKGNMVVETRGAEDILPRPDQFPSPKGVNVTDFEVAYATSPNGNPAWIISGLANSATGAESYTCHIALDVSHVEEELGEMRETMILVVVLAAAAAAVLGWFIVRRSLRPLAEISAAAHRVTASGLDETIGAKPWPRELVSLVGEFDGMLARLRHSFERLSQFTADAAHEFRTPLNNLLGATSLALARPRSQEEYRGLLEANLEEYQRLSHMMERLLFLARADNTQTVLRVQQMDAGAFVREVAEFFSALAEDRGVAVHCEGEGGMVADPALFRMALTNLVSNALRHSPRGTTLRLTVSGDATMTRVMVADEGEGIPAEHLPRLFDRFYRAEASRATEGGQTGAGLGLALVKTIMELHGGRVTVESTVGKGTTFRLEFPVSGPPPQATAPISVA